MTMSRPQACDLYGDIGQYPDPAVTRRPADWRVRRYLPGFMAVGIATLAVLWLTEHYHMPPTLIGLLVGFSLNFLAADQRVLPGLHFVSSTLLRVGIVLLGLRISLNQIIALGWPVFAATVVIALLVICIGVAVSRLAGFGRDFGILAGASVAICGASAALAVAELLGDRRVSRADLTIVLVAVTAASALAMTFYPPLIVLLAAGDKAGGFIAGAAVHDVAQALAAGYAISDPAGEIATIIKLSRVALLAPLLFILGLCLTSPPGDSTARPVRVPGFLIGFLAMVAVNSIVVLPHAVTTMASGWASDLILVAIIANAMTSPIGLLTARGLRPVIPVAAATLAALLFAIAASLVLFGNMGTMSWPK